MMETGLHFELGVLLCGYCLEMVEVGGVVCVC